MKLTFAFLTVAMASPALAAPITVSATGIVDALNSYGANGVVVGSTIAAKLTFDSATDTISAFTIGTHSLGTVASSYVTSGLAGTTFVDFTATDTAGNAFDLNLQYASLVSTVDLPLFLNNAGGFDSNPADVYSAITYTNASPNYGIEAVVNTFAAPEPMTLAVLGTAAAALVSARRRR